MATMYVRNEKGEFEKIGVGGVTTDTTLSVVGKPADANAVGNALANCVPAGFGPNGQLANIANLNSAMDTGWFIFGADSTNKPSDFNYGVLTVIRRNNGPQIFQSIEEIIGGLKARRVYDNGAWEAWEFENPPMNVGVEYRTIERFKGKPVYVKMLDFGQLPNNTTKAITTNVHAKNIISVTGITYGGSEMIQFPIGNSGNFAGYCYLNGTSLSVRSTADLSNYATTYFTIKYIKE